MFNIRKTYTDLEHNGEYIFIFEVNFSFKWSNQKDLMILLCDCYGGWLWTNDISLWVELLIIL